MPNPPRSRIRERPYLREGLLLFGFVLLLAASVVSVVLPELGREPEPETVKPPAATQTASP